MYMCTYMYQRWIGKEKGRQVTLSVASSIGTGILGPDGPFKVLDIIDPVRDKWYIIGEQLGIPPHALDAIKAKCSSTADCLAEMLKHWLTHTSITPPPTWSGLVQALSSAPVAEMRLAEEIREQLCYGDAEQATGSAPGEVWRNDDG